MSHGFQVYFLKIKCSVVQFIRRHTIAQCDKVKDKMFQIRNNLEMTHELLAIIGAA